ncbi:helix-turn-helix domain-containing protein [Staphylococcus auricularis]|uniref:Helix-turn-helix domain-containing protein n=1 Tax=Staphylococcus auricularis TaxID=29379 RepID=A0ABX5IBK6_9STAP|nr:helix-turn-helix domain-containing protein [Staphylococcus auricularis]MCE5039495.1 transposase [Staphylococcus auricularis]MEB6570446.1 transposase [Staphylococcus auricularis]PTH12429.1 helix-turn-helix domain-containing protein [Staphylococcus auricularis]PTH27265.1 helix-turn-helix domain-containing protein [Staphylococcus auricularis]
MGKHYKYDFKMKVVKEYLNGKQGYDKLTKKYGLPSNSMIIRWVDQYKELGPEGLDKKLKNNSYSRDFKVSVLNFRQQNKLSYRETANHFKISNPSMLAAWQRKFDDEGILGLEDGKRGSSQNMSSKNNIKADPLKESEREELERLRTENEMLKAGIAYQKKLQALTQSHDTKHKKR